MQTKDTLAVLLAYLFAEDKKNHPMPPQQKETLLKIIQTLLHSNAINNDKDNKGDQNHRQTEAD